MVQTLEKEILESEVRLVELEGKPQNQALWDLYIKLTKEHNRRYAELEAKYDKLLQHCAELELKLQVFEEKYNELIKKPKKNSDNSSIAPSQDINRNKKKVQKQECKPFRWSEGT